VVVSFYQDLEETTSSVLATSAECSPRWIVYPNTTISGAIREIKNIATQQQCLDACVANSSCFAVDWSIYGCWMGDRHHIRSDDHENNVATFVLVRCDITTGNYLYANCSNIRAGASKISKKLEIRSVERGICPIATSTMNELFSYNYGP